MKIFLIRPPAILAHNEKTITLPPLGLGYLASYLEKRGHKIKILDSEIEGKRNVRAMGNGYDLVGLEYTEIVDLVNGFKPDLVGVSWQYSRQIVAVEQVLMEIKNFDRSLPIVVGGAHPSALPYQTLQNPNVDFLVIGEGENTFSQLLDTYQGDQNFEHIDGSGYKESSGKIKINPKTRYIEDLDSLPFPARHLMPMERYFEEISTYKGASQEYLTTTIMTSRGCPGKCVFCSIHTIWGHKWRGRTPENILAEIEQLIKDYGIKEIHFIDDNLIYDQTRAKQIFQEMINRNVGLKWRTPNGIAIKKITPELMILMKKSGCYHLSPAIESGNQYILNKVIKKGLDLEHLRLVVEWAKKLDIKTDGFFVIGMPGETEKTIYDSLNLAVELDLDSAEFFLAQPYPGTCLMQLCQENEYGFQKDYKMLRTSSSSISTPFLNDKQLYHLQKILYHEFVLKKKLKHIPETIRELLNLKNDIELAKEFAAWLKHKIKLNQLEKRLET